MVIMESILIKGDVRHIWKTFTDLAGWAHWNTVATKAASQSGRIEEGEILTACLRPFSVPLTIKPKIIEVIPREKVVWTARLLGISARHEFLFQQASKGVLVISRETFRGLPLLLGRAAFPEAEVRKLTARMLRDLRKAAEKIEAGVRTQRRH